MPDPVSFDAGPVAWFTADHRQCDVRWTEVEAAVDDDDAPRIVALWTAFDGAIRRHLDMEEQVLFPAFEAATGMTQGPTQMMRYEHQQLRGLLDQMGNAVTAEDWGVLLDYGDTLNMVVQQHNVKEEGMLYPMMEMHLGREWPALAAKLARY